MNRVELKKLIAECYELSQNQVGQSNSSAYVHKLGILLNFMGDNKKTQLVSDSVIVKLNNYGFSIEQVEVL